MKQYIVMERILTGNVTFISQSEEAIGTVHTEEKGLDLINARMQEIKSSCKPDDEAYEHDKEIVIYSKDKCPSVIRWEIIEEI